MATSKPTGIVVAIVDDNSRVLESLKSLFEAAGHSVSVFLSPAAFLHHGNLDAVGCLISDVGMPTIDGFELRQLLIKNYPRLPVILISGRVEIDIEQAKKVRVYSFFRKPFNSLDLLASVEKALTEFCERR